MKVEDLKEGDHIAVTSPLGNRACGKITMALPTMAVFRACSMPIDDYIRADNVHLVSVVDRCVSSFG